MSVLKIWAVALPVIAFVSYWFARWTESNLEFWFKYFGNETDVPLWLAWLLGIVLNAVIFGLNVISEIAELLV
jgi:hypothetical protein